MFDSWFIVLLTFLWKKMLIFEKVINKLRFINQHWFSTWNLLILLLGLGGLVIRIIFPRGYLIGMYSSNTPYPQYILELNAGQCSSNAKCFQRSKGWFPLPFPGIQMNLQNICIQSRLIALCLAVHRLHEIYSNIEYPKAYGSYFIPEDID